MKGRCKKAMWFRKGLLCIMWNKPFWLPRRPASVRIEKLVWGKRIKYGINLLPGDVWFYVWLPKWCKGRGYYISIGLWLFSIHRGY